MMGKTTNYGLYVENDAKTKFKDWREKMAGEGIDSNMELIDRILGEKANNNKVYELVLSATEWSEAYPYTQTVAVEDLMAEDSGVIGLAPGLSTMQSEVAAEALLSIQAQEDGALTIQASGDKPTCNIPIVLIIFG